MPGLMSSTSSANRTNIDWSAFCPEEAPPEVQQQWSEIIDLKRQQARLREVKDLWKEKAIMSLRMFQECLSENQELSSDRSRTLDELRALNRADYRPEDLPAAVKADAESDVRANVSHGVNRLDTELVEKAKVLEQMLTMVIGGRGDTRVNVSSSTCGVGSGSGCVAPPVGKQDVATRWCIGGDTFFVDPPVARQEVSGRQHMDSKPRFMAPPIARQEVAWQTRVGSDLSFAAPSVAQHEVAGQQRMDSGSSFVAPTVIQPQASSRISVGSGSIFVAPPAGHQEVAVVRARTLAQSFAGQELTALLVDMCAIAEDKDAEVLSMSEQDADFGFPNIGRHHLITPTSKHERMVSKSTSASVEFKPFSRGQSKEAASKQAKVVADKNPMANVRPRLPSRVDSAPVVELQKADSVVLPPPSMPWIPGPVPSGKDKPMMLSLTQENLMAVQNSSPVLHISNSAMSSKSASCSGGHMLQSEENAVISVLPMAKKKPIRRAGRKHKKSSSQAFMAEIAAMSSAPSKDAEAMVSAKSSAILDVMQTKPADESVMSSMMGLAAAQMTVQSVARKNAWSRFRILKPNVTTLVIRNIPAWYKQSQLLEEWPHDVKYDLLYSPYSFLNKCNLGYAFMNFKTHEYALEFQQEWQGCFLKRHGNGTCLDIAQADVQGYRANLELLRGKNIDRLGNEDFLPALFDGMTRLDTRSVLHSMSITGPAVPRQGQRLSVTSIVGDVAGIIACSSALAKVR